MLKFLDRRSGDNQNAGGGLQDILSGFSIEVMPRTAAKIADFRDLLPEGTRVYVAHIEGTPIDDMVATAKRIREEGFPVMPHFPARLIDSVHTLQEWIARYRDEAGVDQALLLAGGASQSSGTFDNSMQLMETGLFDKYGFKRLHVAGHPEGNKDIDADGSTALVDKALQWKQAFSGRTDAEMAIVTQFAFDAKAVIEWAERLDAAGITLPIHVGVAGPAKLQTLIKYAVSCGVGPSIKVLQRRAMDMKKLLLPYTPDEILTELAEYRVSHPDSLIAQVHFFPLGGIRATADWTGENTSAVEWKQAI